MNKRTRGWSLVAVVIAVVLVPMRASSTLGTYVAASIWRTHTISVCWEDSAMDGAFAQQRAAVQSQVHLTWEAASDVHFVGWESCASKRANVHIGVADDAAAPRCLVLGNALDGMHDGMVLNFTFNNWSSDYCLSRVDECVRSVAAHEFGHALGFAHEQNRIDTPRNATSPQDSRVSCKEMKQGEDGDVCFGAWDANSIMNYCNKNWNGNGLLSATDKGLVATLYGPHPGAAAPPHRPSFGCRQTPVPSGGASAEAPSTRQQSSAGCPKEFPKACCAGDSGPICVTTAESCIAAKKLCH